MKLIYEDNKEIWGYFEYEPDEDKLNDKITSILAERYFPKLELEGQQKKVFLAELRAFMLDLSADEQIKMQEDFRDEITEYFEREARNE